jgi:hypothetical protein
MMDLTVKLPLSGAVSQWFSMFDGLNQNGQIGLLNVEIGQSADPALERDLLTKAGSYGRQIGRLTDAMVALAKAYRGETVTADDEAAIDLFMIQAKIVALTKRGQNIEKARQKAAALSAARRPAPD